MAKLEVKDECIPFEIVRRKRKTLEIQIDSQNGFRVLAPNRISEKAILLILEPKKEWIYEKWLEVKMAQSLKPQKTYSDGELFVFNDQQAVLKLIEKPNLKQSRAILQDGILLIEGSNLDRETVRSTVIALYKQYTKLAAIHRLEKYTALLGVKYNRLVVKEQKRRWGSCSHLGNLNFNWRCGLMPDFVFEYILVHEVCHLVHLNHSKLYWDLVASLCPEYAEARLWLKKQGSTLDI